MGLGRCFAGQGRRLCCQCAISVASQIYSAGRSASSSAVAMTNLPARKQPVLDVRIGRVLNQNPQKKQVPCEQIGEIRPRSTDRSEWKNRRVSRDARAVARARRACGIKTRRRRRGGVWDGDDSRAAPCSSSETVPVVNSLGQSEPRCSGAKYEAVRVPDRSNVVPR